MYTTTVNLFRTNSQDGRGGGSGQSVVDPRKIMERARQNGAVSASEHEQNRFYIMQLNQTKSRFAECIWCRSRAFVGSGYALSGEGGAAVVQNEDEKALKHRSSCPKQYSMLMCTLRHVFRLWSLSHP
jgi:hypothetical protein